SLILLDTWLAYGIVLTLASARTTEQGVMMEGSVFERTVRKALTSLLKIKTVSYAGTLSQVCLG
ncbi:hypothetical protein OFN55_37235, partial [Escherichia coli]|nr:hypothetical protein [Escherichia coli]